MKTYYYVDRQTMQELADLLTLLKKCKWFWQRWGNYLANKKNMVLV